MKINIPQSKIGEDLLNSIKNSKSLYVKCKHSKYPDLTDEEFVELGVATAKLLDFYENRPKKKGTWEHLELINLKKFAKKFGIGEEEVKEVKQKQVEVIKRKPIKPTTKLLKVDNISTSNKHLPNPLEMGEVVVIVEYPMKSFSIKNPFTNVTTTFKDNDKFVKVKHNKGKTISTFEISSFTPIGN